MNDINKWFSLNGDKTFRLNYELNEKSVVFDIGGYQGDWSKEIYNKYGCNIIVFEPLKEHYENIKKLFLNNDKIIIHNFGLSDKDEEMEIAILGDATSLFKLNETNNIEKIKLVDSNVFLENYDIIDLMKINIEGSEYGLLNYFIKHNIQHKIKNIQIQFHSFIDNAHILKKEIENELLKTHKKTYDFPFIWENWEKF